MNSLPALRNHRRFLNLNFRRQCGIVLRYSTTKGSEDSEGQLDLPPSFADDDKSQQPKPEGFFNKSGLRPQHRKFLFNQPPYSEPYSWIHLTEKYQRKQLGRYGLISGVNPRICFSTQDEIANEKRRQSIAQPHTLQELTERLHKVNTSIKEQVDKREEDIAKKLEKLEQWKADLKSKIAKKEADALAAKERKERLIEEVRRHFGFKVDPREERFKEMLELKEKEDRKKQKEAKRKAKEEKMMAKLLAKSPAADLHVNKEQ